MAKKPKKQWQIEVRSKLEQLGIGYLELAEQTGLNEGSIRQVMSKDNAPGIRETICNHLGIQINGISAQAKKHKKTG